ncbi:hypothetical protein BKA62DRAFT_292820 [Auriculariales sp. MPI-PUGE-AT-0066]|nr:hypothetical protein BKA62DRAFT_292820 [Auriculariales sp. MPI-PUGE-AT-0066]
MAPKKGQKMSLNEFLGDSTLGSWADEMDSLPTAPSGRDDAYAGRGDRDFGRGGGDRFDRFSREELPLPTSPPYTAFIGNLSFELTESELESHFADCKTKTVKIIRDRDDKPKGFGYVEFMDLDGLKAALALSGSAMGSRTIRVNVADPPKEREGGRSGFGGGDRGGFDDDKFSGDWRRSGPLPPRDEPKRSRFGGDDDGFRRGSRFEDGPDRGSRFERDRPEREPRESTQAESNDDWRSNRPTRASVPELSVDMPQQDRPVRRSGFPTPTGGPVSAADSEEKWSIGSKFKPAPSPASPGPDRGPRSFTGGGGGGGAGRGERPPMRDAPTDEPNDWRSGPRRNLSQTGRGAFGDSPSNSTPPTPVMTRRKLELTPRSGAPSNATSPLGSPKQASAQPATPPAKSNPFGAARPVDVTQREKEVSERMERDRETTRAREPVAAPRERAERPEAPSTTNSWRRPSVQTNSGGASDPPSRQTSRPTSPVPASATSTTMLSPISRGASANVRPAFSFANAAKSSSNVKSEMDDLAEKTAEVSV